MRTVTWTEMADGTQDDYRLLDKVYIDHARGGLVDNLLTILATLKGPKLGYQVDRYADSPHFEACRRFCADYDQNCFDPDYDTLPIEAFESALDEVFSRPSRLPSIG